MNSFKVEFDKRTKLILLLLIITVLAAEIFFSERREKRPKEMNKKVDERRLKKVQGNERSFKERVDLKKLYGKEFSKKNPFYQPQVNRAEFSYDLPNSDAFPKLTPLKSSLQLRGIINHSRVIINYQGQTLLCKLGAEIDGYKIIEIQDDRVIYIKEGRKYFSNLTVQRS